MVSLAYILLGSESISVKTIFKSIFKYNNTLPEHDAIINQRLPRLIAAIMVGASLSIAGAIMQGNTKNPMADTGVMGISSGSMFGILLMIAFFPNAGRFIRILISSIGALIAIILIYSISYLGRKKATPERLVLAGMAVSTLFGSVTTAIVLQKGLMSKMLRYTVGSMRGVIWKDIYIAVPFFIVGIIIALVISRTLTVLNLGEDVSKGLGANVKLIKFLSSFIVLILTAISVIIIGPVSYVGLMVPHIVRYFVGTDYRYIIPASGVVGGFFVLFFDLIARLVIRPFEFPVSIVITLIGVPFFIYISRKRNYEQ